MDTEFMRMLGFRTINLTATSTAKWGASRLRVALVLDTTGSMASDGKIGALITATKNLLGQLQSAASVDGDVYVSIIPFAKDVRIENNYDSTWDDWIYWDNQAKSDPNSWDATHGKCNTSGSILLRSNCVSACSLSNLHDAEHLYGRGNLLDIRQLQPISLHECRYLYGIGQKQPEHMHVCRHLLDFRQFIQIRVQFGGGLLIVAVDDAKQV